MRWNQRLDGSINHPLDRISTFSVKHLIKIITFDRYNYLLFVQSLIMQIEEILLVSALYHIQIYVFIQLVLVCVLLIILYWLRTEELEPPSFDSCFLLNMVANSQYYLLSHKNIYMRSENKQTLFLRYDSSDPDTDTKSNKKTKKFNRRYNYYAYC